MYGTQEYAAIEADITARIKFSGALIAQCVLEFPSASAQKLTEAFLGSSESEWDDSMVADTVGELCNMIAGGWKKRLGETAWGADLSIPFLTLGSRPDAGVTRLCRAYAFDDSLFVVSLKFFPATS